MVILMSESIVNRYLKNTMADMYRNEREEIRCPCRKCKLRTLHRPETCIVRDHLLMHGFMDGHTQWLTEEDDDPESHGAAGGNDQEGRQDNNDEQDNKNELDNNDEGQEEPDPTHDV